MCIRDRDVLVLERVRGIFRGKITYLGIHYPEDFTAGIGPALAQFSSLRQLTIYDDGGRPGADPHALDELFAAIAEMGSLTHLNLSGEWVTDSRLAKLGSMPTLEHLALGGSAITPLSLSWIDTLPALKTLDLTETYAIPSAPVSEFARAHPGVKVTAPTP